ncbi:MAG: DUF47 family protein [Planctomycetota bacterium]
MGLKEWIIPQDRVFFDLLDEIADLQHQASSCLRSAVEEEERIFENSLRIKEIENHCDSVVHRVFTHLNSSFITPIEHEDIAQLAHRLDDIIDCLNGAVSRMYLYNALPLPASTRELCDVITRATGETLGAVKSLRKMKNKEAIRRHCVEINRLENVADEISQKIIAEMYKKGDVLNILKQKEIIMMLESATDRCEDVADIISNIVVKNA